MPKLRTHKATSKRFRVTKNGKIEKRTSGQNHFNSRGGGKVGRNKKSDFILSQRLRKVMNIALPN